MTDRYANVSFSPAKFVTPVPADLELGGDMSKRRKETRGVKADVTSKARANALKKQRVGGQRLPVNTRRQVGVHALRQSLRQHNLTVNHAKLKGKRG